MEIRSRDRMLRLQADREPFVPVSAAPGVAVGAKGGVQPVHRLTPRGGMPVTTVEAYSHCKAIYVGASHAKAHAAVEHYGKAHLPSVFTIGEPQRFKYVHFHTSLVAGLGCARLRATTATHPNRLGDAAEGRAGCVREGIESIGAIMALVRGNDARRTGSVDTGLP